MLVCMALCYFMQTGFAQKIIGAETRYNNSFREWTLYTEDEELRGELRMRWTFQDDWTAWDWSVGDVDATIEQKWPEDPNLWIIRCQGVMVNAKTAWPGEFRRWKLNDGKNQINWESKYENRKDEWEMDVSGDSPFLVHTYWEGDIREWEVVDELSADISEAMKVAMIFLSLHFSTPKR
jgi:hypothetical protein